MKAIINISLKQGVLDPQGLAIQNSLSNLGFNNCKMLEQVNKSF